MHLIKINPKVYHPALHVFVLHANLHNIGMFVARVLAHGFEHLAVEDRHTTGAAIFREQARAVDIDPVVPEVPGA
jgi:hypothetical protein